LRHTSFISFLFASVILQCLQQKNNNIILVSTVTRPQVLIQESGEKILEKTVFEDQFFEFFPCTIYECLL
jgi:hypothetical protein